jgi:endonuclease-8
MAEGDTILRAKHRLAGALVGQTIAVSAPNPRGRAAGIERLDGRTLEGIEAHGKHLIFDFGDLVLHSHLGMSGGWHVYKPRERWRRPRSSAWAVLGGEHHEAVEFGGPTLRVLPASRVAIDPQLARLGPDILAEDLDLDDLVARFRAGDGSRTLGDALLDQRLVAGIGNIFKSESCFAARLDPWHPPGGGQRRRPPPRPHRGPRPDARRRQDRQPPPLRRLQTSRPLRPLSRHRPPPRPGRRQPHHLVVRALPALTAAKPRSQKSSSAADSVDDGEALARRQKERTAGTSSEWPARRVGSAFMKWYSGPARVLLAPK